MRRVDKKNYLGVRYWFDDYALTQTEEDGLLQKGDISGTEGGIITGLGLIYQYDTRDHINYPTKGTFFEGVLYSSENWMGSDYRHQRVYLDYRRYLKIKGNHILALNAYGRMNFGNTPFDDLALFGGSKSCLLYTSPSPRDATLSRMPSSA